MARAALFLVAILASAASTAEGANQTVANCSNDVELRADLTAMQASGGGTLTFSCATTTIVVTSALPDIVANTKIDGGGKITLSGGNSSRLFVVQPSGTLELEDIALTSGSSTGDGGAIFSFGVLALRRSEVRNSASALSGGGIVTYGPLTIEDSTFSGNRAANGGAVYARFSPSVVTIHDSEFHHNETTDKSTGIGGAILLWDGATVTIDGSYFYDNHAAQGGAVHNPFTNSSVTIRDSRFERNVAGFEGFPFDLNHGGAVFGAGTLTVESTSFRDNATPRFGGAVYVLDAEVTIEDSVIRGGTASDGGGIMVFEDSVLTVRRSTIYDNEASQGAGVTLYYDNVATFENVTFAANEGESGSAVFNFDSHVTLSNSTVHANVSAGAAVFAGEELAVTSLRNTILSGNSGFNCSVSDGFVSLDGNLSDDDSCTEVLAGLHDVHGVDPLLAISETSAAYEIVYVPQPGSPAVDGGVASGAPSHDQRNVPRPQGDSHDRGAVEVAACPANVICGDATGDGSIVSADALVALRTAVGSGTCPPWRCDFNGDDAITASDALAILRKAVGQNPAANCPEAWDCVDAG